MAKLNYAVDNIQQLISTSYSFAETSRKLNNGNYNNKVAARIKDIAMIHNISTDHFLANGKHRTKNRIITDAIMFSRNYRIGYSSNSGSSNKRVMNRMIELGKEYQCDHCSISTWNDKPLRLQLEHIDGDNHNYELHNLAFLCPNCHSQTTTFGGRNVKRKQKEQTIDANIN